MIHVRTCRQNTHPHKIKLNKYFFKKRIITEKWKKLKELMKCESPEGGWGIPGKEEKSHWVFFVYGIYRDRNWINPKVFAIKINYFPGFIICGSVKDPHTLWMPPLSPRREKAMCCVVLSLPKVKDSWILLSTSDSNSDLDYLLVAFSHLAIMTTFWPCRCHKYCSNNCFLFIYMISL